MKPKHLILILILILFFTNYCKSQCLVPGTGASLNQTPTSIDIYVGTTTGAKIVEYGAPGFTPGTGATAGVGGTVVNFPAGNGNWYTVSGLTPATDYQFYNRQNCGGGVFSANSTAKNSTTVPDCATAPVYTSPNIQSVSFASGNGAWTVCNSDLARENFFRFTPTVSGNHVLFLPIIPNQNQTVIFSYKPLSGGCTQTGWSCIGQSLSWQTEQVSFGPLTAGTTYLIMASPNNPTLAVNGSFRIESPYCASPANVNISGISANSFFVSTTSGATVVEFGPAGFVPGTGFSAGSGGTVVNYIPGNAVSGLINNTAYDVYMRMFCGSFFSPNSTRVGLTTTSCPTTSTYGALGSTSNFTFGFSGTGAFNSHILGCYPDGAGDENQLIFNAPSSGNFDVHVNQYLNGGGGLGVNFALRPSQPGCTTTNYMCQGPVNTTYYSSDYTIGSLTANANYDMLFEAIDSFAWGNADVTITCGKITGLAASSITSNSANLNFTCNCPNTTYIEYGPYGFTPGTGATPGGGALITTTNSTYALTGLSSYTLYDVYARVSCGGNFSNNVKVSFRTLINCASAPVINCGDLIAYNSTGLNGAWTIPGCGSLANNSLEQIYKFTPTTSGTHLVNFYQNYGYGIQAAMYYKPVGTCDTSGWTCIGTLTSAPYNLNWGPLTAGTSYYLLVDAHYSGAWYNKFLQIQCPNTCYAPVNITKSGITPTSAIISGNCNGCSTLYLEYGNAGFTPGTSTAPGNGGTVVSNITLPYTISGLLPAHSYDVYIRQNCGVPNGFSANSSVVNVTTTCNNAPNAIIPSTSSFTTCAGVSLTLTQNAGIPAPGGSIKWYTGSCGGTLVGTGNSITISPTVTTTYFVRAESSCGNSTCFSQTITVLGSPSATITASGPTTFCAGGSVTLDANTGTGLTYVWKKYANIIAGATSPGYSTSSAGKYKCIVTNTSGCSKSSNTVEIIVNPLPASTITANGPVTFCNGDSVKLSANTGSGLTYQWRKYSNNISGATLANYTAKQAGKYKCVVTNGNGCSKTSNSIIISVPCREGNFTIGQTEQFSIYPNPSAGVITVEAEFSMDEQMFIEIYDVQGRRVISKTTFDNKLLINDPVLLNGFYDVIIRYKDSIHKNKITIIN